jgi:hypothetical protein
MLSMPNAGDPRHASDAASSKQRFTSNDLERMEGGFYLRGQRPIVSQVSQARGSLCLCAAQACLAVDNRCGAGLATRPDLNRASRKIAAPIEINYYHEH